MREIHCQGDAPGIGYRGQDCRNVTIHPPDNAFPGSCTQSRERHLYGSSTQSLTRNSGGAVCARGMKLLSQSFYPLSAETTQGRAAAPGYNQCLCQAVPIPQGSALSWAQQGHHTVLVPALRLGRVELPLPHAQLAQELPQPQLRQTLA